MNRNTESSFLVVDNGQRSILLKFPGDVGEDMVRKIVQYGLSFEKAAVEGVLDVVPAYSSLMIHFDPAIVSRDTVEAAARDTVSDNPDLDIPVTPKLIIPICYDEEVAPDLEWIASYCDLSVQNVIKLHVKSSYRVYMLGFIPGFVYLGGMDERLACPRRPTPRSRIERGSVGIAGGRTGIYSLESPGGWQIIGRTPVSLFEPHRDNPFLASHMQEIEFRKISLPELDGWTG